jgi:predicted regulator of Ras-like GTPase activity (Roadblock/LC7/MglB family)
MQVILNEVNTVPGVIGSFVSLPDGKIVAQSMPEKYAPADLTLAARVTSQTFQALELSGQRVTEAALLFSEGRLVLKNFRGGTLIILCARNINVPLLNLTANVAVKKLVTETRTTKPVAPAPGETKPPAPPLASAATSPTAPAPVDTAAPPPPAAPVAPAEIALPPLLDELQKECQQIVGAASSAHVPLWVIDPVALWHRCKERPRLLTVPRRRQVDLTGQFAQVAQITQFLENLGYHIGHKLRAGCGCSSRLLSSVAFQDCQVACMGSQIEHGIIRRSAMVGLGEMIHAPENHFHGDGIKQHIQFSGDGIRQIN